MLDIPSYSVAKSVVAGLALMRMERLHPGTRDLPVDGFAPASDCRGDVFDDLLGTDVLGPLGLSPATRATRRNSNDARQPFFGWGLTLHVDDIAKLARFLGEQRGRIDGRDLLDAAMFDAAMQRDPGQPGLPVATLERYRYQHGFWARNLHAEFGCERPTWVPFMSSFGGVTVVHRKLLDHPELSNAVPLQPHHGGGIFGGIQSPRTTRTYAIIGFTRTVSVSLAHPTRKARRKPGLFLCAAHSALPKKKPAGTRPTGWESRKSPDQNL